MSGTEGKRCGDVTAIALKVPAWTCALHGLDQLDDQLHVLEISPVRAAGVER